MDKLLNELGADFKAAWELVEDTDPASEGRQIVLHWTMLQIDAHISFSVRASQPLGSPAGGLFYRQHSDVGRNA